MARKKKKLSKGALSAIIITSVTVALLVALFIFNLFIPVRYVEAYFVGASPIERGKMRVTYIDAGLGDSAIVELPDGKTVLIDGGDGSYQTNKAVLKALNTRGIEKIDYLICTSVKDGHCGGLTEILKLKEVGKAFIPYSLNRHVTDEFYAFTTALEDLGIETAYACTGEGIVGGEFDYFLTFLSPLDVQNPDSEYAVMNKRPDIDNVENASAIVWLEYDGIAFVFSSDVRPKAQQRVIEEYGRCALTSQPFCPIEGHAVELEKCKFVTLPNHGAEKNTCVEWYDALTPEQAIVSVGINYADYPSNLAIANVGAYCQPMYTQYDGNITVTVSDGDYTVEKQY